jgi:copper chaperone CopZ
MTQLDVIYRYGAAPSERAQLALSKVRDVYGIRRVEVREAEKTVRVEYDASRLTDAAIHKLLRRAGLDIVETVAGSAQPEEGSVLTLRCYENP